MSLPHHHGSQAHTAYFQRELEKNEQFYIAAELFKQLGDPTRIRIFWLLSHCEECVVNLSALLGMSSPALSHHLRALKDCGLIQSRREGKEVYYKTADTEVCRILHQMVEQVMEITCPEYRIAHGISQTELILHVHEYLITHIEERITIEALSKRFLINQTTLKQAFKDVYGTSLAAHMKKHRMERAARLLRETGENIAQIARSVGYGSQSRFTVAFKEHFGTSPTEYRNDNRLKR